MAYCFPQGLRHFTVPLNRAQGYQFLHILTNTCYFLLWFVAILMDMKRYLILALTWISFMIKDTEHLLQYLLAICMSSLKMC